MATDRKMHVLGLSPREQFLIRILLSNLMAGYIDKSIQEAPSIKTMEVLEQRSVTAINFFWKYNEFCDLLCPESMLGRAKTKVLLVEHEMMKYLILAVNGYDDRDCMLSQKYRDYLASGFESLRKKIIDSSHFMYDRWEIDKAKNSGQS